MLTITIAGEELWDREREVFKYTPAIVLEFEHSLVSVSKWEAIYHKPFLTSDKKTDEEMVSYVECMLLSADVNPETLLKLTPAHAELISSYINNPMSGTTVSEMPQPKQRQTEKMSAELIYFWMNHFQIPYDARYWHLNQLFALIKIHHAKSQKPKRMSKQKNVQTMSELNAARKAKLGTTG